MKEDVTTKSNEIACKTPKLDHTSEEREDKGTKLLSIDNVDQQREDAKEEKGKMDIANVYLLSNKPNRVNLTTILKEPCGSSKENYIVPMILKEKPVVEVPHMDFIFEDHQ